MKTLRNILVVDDDVRVLGSLSELLERDGFNCFPARCPSEALEIAASHELEASILDHFLGARTGLQTLIELRRIHAELAAILMSGNLTPDIVNEARRLGRVTVLDKPIEIAHLRVAISRLAVS